MEPRKCEHCSNDLPEDAHINRLYCDARCNSAAYYQRHRNDPVWYARKLAKAQAWNAAHREQVRAAARTYKANANYKRRRFAQIMGVAHG